ncbi:hypothetical protein L1987_48085 [Smallanthus sonchifolius]|uniref:Uncharacterized protein n=1 Tax=Smallanthus sonchifolius TaxID=185202 RepID=A0ACB9FRW2_9ASTR|nr:hypothetical protein L1987_48085 [Smallanthus sonchifolius]
MSHSQLSEPHAQALAQAQYVQAEAQPQARAAHARFQAQLLANVNTQLVLQKQNLIGEINIKCSAAMELTTAARRQKQGSPEKQVLEKVAAFLTESALYTQLLEF